MVSRENITREVLSELETRRARSREQERARRDEASARSPRIGELLAERQRSLLAGVKGAFTAPGSAQRISDELKGRIAHINAELARELERAGLPRDYLQPIYQCPICRDTGYVGEPVHEQCVCLRREVMNRLYKSEGLQGLEHENFDAFDENVFPDEPRPGAHTQREDARRLREIGEKYASEFAPGEGRGLLLFGKTGLGKTFLMNCIAQRVLERGYSVAVVSAYKLVEIMRAWQFSGEGADRVQDFLACDLLCIDDLGSEPMIRSVTVSAIYHIVSERCSAGRAMVVTTNCDVAQLYERYDERVAARLCDQGRMRILPFTGADVRRFAAQRGSRA